LGWRFQSAEAKDSTTVVGFDDSAWILVSLPHSFALYNANLDGFKESGRTVGWYRRQLAVPAEWTGKKLFLEFQGAMQATTLWVNGAKVGEYTVSGYDSFDFDITRQVKAGTNVLTVKVDNTPNPNLPPDGGPIDYTLFGGLYRDVFLHVKDPVHLTFPWSSKQAGVRLTLPEVSAEQAVVQVESTIRNEFDKPRTCTLVAEIRDRDGKVVKTLRETKEVAAGADATFVQKSDPLTNPRLWSPDDAYLYTVRCTVLDGDRELDRTDTRLGIRWVKFDKQEGFFLNGKHLKLIGANYHQTWPYIGNAVPNGLQRRDAEQMKAMGINWVRLSHYPHDPDFLDMLDELGLMALEEPATWSQAGNAQWMDNLEKSLRSMIRRDRNHPSIIVWGVAINHRNKEPRLVQAAIEEDPTRDRGQDTVPTPMNFRPMEIWGNGALAIEHTGHTFPTARGTREVRRRKVGDEVEIFANREYSHAARHWEQVNAAYQKEDNSGLAVWCMYDYNTFHNVDERGMVWHGVCDLFRFPKYSYWWHQSELTSDPMAYVVRIDDTRAAVFSNCQEVRLSQDTGKGYRVVATQKPDKTFTSSLGTEVPFALHHPPFHFAVDPVAKSLKAEGLIDGKVRSTYEWKRAGDPVALRVEADRKTITADGSDLSRIIVTAVDTNGTPVETFTGEVSFAAAGAGQLIGENPVKLRAGQMIILAQSAFVPGDLTVTATAAGLRSGSATVKTLPPPANVDLPSGLPEHPSEQKMAAPRLESPRRPQAIGSQ
jgi:beta-galactosidase